MLGTRWGCPFTYQSKKERNGSGRKPGVSLHQNNSRMPSESSPASRLSHWSRRLWISEISQALWNK